MHYKMDTKHFQPYWRVTKETLLAFILGLAGAIIAFVPFGLDAKTWLNPEAFLISNLSFYTIVFLYLKQKLKSFHPLNLENFNWLVFCKLSLIFIPYIILIGVLSILINISGFAEEVFENIFQQNQLIFFLNFVILAPIMEELIFRGVLFSYLLKYAPQRQAVLFSSLLFGLTHGSPDQMVSATLGGIFLAYTCIKSNALVVPILFHAINNSLSFLVMILE